MNTCRVDFPHRGGAPIGAGGHDPHFSRQRVTGDKVNVENKDNNRKYQHQCQSATNQTKELGWLSYLSNILSPHGQKVGGGSKNFSASSARKIVPPLSKPWRRPCFRATLCLSAVRAVGPCRPSVMHTRIEMALDIMKRFLFLFHWLQSICWHKG